MAEKQQKNIPLPVLSYAVRLFMVGRRKWEPNPFLSNISKAARFCDREKSAKLNKNRKNCKGEKTEIPITDSTSASLSMAFLFFIYFFFFRCAKDRRKKIPTMPFYHFDKN